MLRKQLSIIYVLFALLLACQGTDDIVSPKTPESLLLLTYNVRGLPDGITDGNPEINMGTISGLLNNYDIALVQEDFAFHPELISKSKHQYKSNSNGGLGPFDLGDGLNRMSKYEFRSFERVEWDTCSSAEAADCLAQKGFSVAETLIGGLAIDIYNLHMDAGSADSDIRARQIQVSQLIDTIIQRSAGKAIIIAGDFNLNTSNRPQDTDMFERLLQETGLSDACEVNNCGRELIDKVLFRGNDALILTCDAWSTDTAFVDSTGNNLSDHLAVSAKFGLQPRQASKSSR